MCLSPFVVNRGGVLQTFSCGRCFECIRKRKNDWIIRLHSEMSNADVSFFSLISYNEENYPNPDLYDIPAIQRLIKSLRMRLTRNFQHMRKDLNKPIQLKYFIVSEYGELKNRLHYHAIFFLYNIKPTECTFVFWKELLENTWSKGFCSAFELCQSTIVYTTKYIQKQYNMMLFSKSLGFEAYRKAYGSDTLNYDEIDTYLINGKSYSCPRSWRDSLRGQQHNTIAARALADKAFYQPTKLTQRQKYLINNKFINDNPHIDAEKPIKQNNLDILPDGEF